MNSKEKQPTFEEWLKKRQQLTKTNEIRASAFYDTAYAVEKDRWTWVRDSYAELHDLYLALESINEERKNDFNYLFLILKTILGLDKSATEKEVVEKAKEFGKLIDVLTERGEQLEKEKELRKKGR